MRIEGVQKIGIWSRVAQVSILGAIGAFLSSGPSLGADLPTTKGPPQPPVIAALPVSSFEGAYVGGAVGAEWARTANKPVRTTGYTDTDIEGENFSAGPGPYGFSDRGKARPAATIDGGYNWRFGSLVVGLEADVGLTNSTAKLKGPSAAVDPADPEAGYSVTGHVQKSWGSSLRARVGWTPINTVLLYGTGGLAVGGVRGTVTETVPNVTNLVGPYGIYQTPAGSVTTNSARWSGMGWGWTIGAGAEAMITDHVSLRGEYLFSQLSGSGKAGSGVEVRNAHLTDQQMRFGVDYHF
ncbi:outer membrane immunogenic protein [Rhizobiales bacterium GAS113]|nr:outer membrane immunogenic protein [Rhizobiales bacterium GAS113]